MEGVAADIQHSGGWLVDVSTTQPCDEPSGPYSIVVKVDGSDGFHIPDKYKHRSPLQLSVVYVFNTRTRAHHPTRWLYT